MVSLSKVDYAVTTQGDLEIRGGVIKTTAHTLTIRATSITGTHTRSSYTHQYPHLEITVLRNTCDLYFD